MDEPTEAVRRLLARAVRAGTSVGAVAAWGSSPGRVRSELVGRAAIVPRPRPATTDTLYDLASLTKPLVVTTLALLAMREGLSLETRVGELLEATRGAPLGELTAVELLTHTSGLPAWAPLYADRSETVLLALARIEPVARPGERIVYSCLGFILLGLVLEAFFGAGLDRCFAERVAAPLGLGEELRYRPDPRRKPLAGGARSPDAEALLLAERGLDGGLVPDVGDGLPDDGNARHLGGVAGNAGLFGTARAVAALAFEYLPDHGRLLDPGEVEVARRCRTAGLDQARGLGWQLAATPGCSAGPALDPSSFGHTGFTGCSLWVDPNARLVLALLTNRHHPAHRGVDCHPLRRRFHAAAIGV